MIVNTKEIVDITAEVSTMIAAIAGTIAALFVSRQVAHMKRSREVDTFLRIIDSGNSEPLYSAAQWVKAKVSPATTYEQSAEIPYRENTSRVINHFEVIGILVYNKFVSKDLIYDQMGPWIVGSWGILQHLIVAHRSAKRCPDYGEYFELLAQDYQPWAEKHPPKFEKRRRATAQDLERFYDSHNSRQP